MAPVFGIEIKEAILEVRPEYARKTITQEDLAREALKLYDADDNKHMAEKFVEKLQEQWGTGVCTKVLIYNASGTPIFKVADHDFHGHIGQSAYPVYIGNGQWGAFLHVKTSGTATGSTAAVVYRTRYTKATDASRVSLEWALSWANPWNRNQWANQAYTEINSNGHWTANDH